ncbi:trypsin-like peptidase domain-containing protein [Planktothricoides raciborskii]|uniref:Serine protease n=1 Tax=Planktothricoides raciborskii GIHE-MW2 TaxID=2792601 RepID=A0AAU8J9L4_9CYAN
MMSWRWQKVGLLLGWLVIGGLGGCSLGKSEEKIAKKAKEFTVIIDGCGAGSGAIIKREGNTYSVLTAYHVVEKSWTCLIFTSDQESYQVRGNTIIQPVPNVDLGVLTFTSDKSYPVAKLGNSEKMVEATSVLVVGAPGIIGRIKTRTLLFNWGKIIGRVPQPKDGYSLIYDANTEPGMSGGPVLNNRGEIVGVHGQGDRDENNIKTGWNLGIPIQIFPKEKKNDDDYIGRLITRINWQKIAMLLVTIANWGIIFVIVVRVFVWIYIYTIIHLFPGDYIDRLITLLDWQNIAILLITIANWGIIRLITLLNRQKIAMLLITIAIGGIIFVIVVQVFVLIYIIIYTIIHYNRRVEYKKPEFKSAANSTKSIKTDNKSAADYYNQGLRNYNLKKYDLAIADYNQAIALDPNDSAAYYNRGIAYSDLKKYDLAIADYNKAIALDQNFANAYYNLGLIAEITGDVQTAIKNYEKAAALYQQQGDDIWYQNAMNNLKRLRGD